MNRLEYIGAFLAFMFLSSLIEKVTPNQGILYLLTFIVMYLMEINRKLKP